MIIKTLSWLIVLVLLAGCSSSYIANSPLVFNSEEKGDCSAHFRQGLYSSNLVVGLAVADNWNVGAQASTLYSPKSAFGAIPFRGAELDGVFGYYNRFTAKHTFEINGGIGAFLVSSPTEISNYAKIFVQPSINFNKTVRNKNWDICLLSRLTRTRYLYNTPLVNDSLVFRGFVEPVLNISIGDQLKFNSQIGLSLPIYNKSDGELSLVVFNIGIGYQFLKNKKRKATLP